MHKYQFEDNFLYNILGLSGLRYNDCIILVPKNVYIQRNHNSSLKCIFLTYAVFCSIMNAITNKTEQKIHQITKLVFLKRIFFKNQSL